MGSKALEKAEEGESEKERLEQGLRRRSLWNNRRVGKRGLYEVPKRKRRYVLFQQSLKRLIQR